MPFSDSGADADRYGPGPYAPIPAGARLTWVLAALVLPVGFLVAANIAALPAAAPFAIYAALEGMTGTLQFWMLSSIILCSFVAFGASAWLWARLFERRGAATIGFTRGPWRYLRGALAGGLLAAAMLALGAVMAPQDVAPLMAGLRRLDSADGAIFLIVFLIIFCFQGGAEEVVFRGWMLSSVAARRGPMVAVGVSTAGFAAVHAHYLWFAPLPGMLVVLGVALIAVIFAFYALAERSIWGVCGAHGLYNYVLMTAATAQALGEDPTKGPLEIASDAFTNITSVTEFDPSVPGTVAMLAVLALISWALWRRTTGRTALTPV